MHMSSEQSDRCPQIWLTLIFVSFLFLLHPITVCHIKLNHSFVVKHLKNISWVFYLSVTNVIWIWMTVFQRSESENRVSTIWPCIKENQVHPWTSKFRRWSSSLGHKVRKLSALFSKSEMPSTSAVTFYVTMCLFICMFLCLVKNRIKWWVHIFGFKLGQEFTTDSSNNCFCFSC